MAAASSGVVSATKDPSFIFSADAVLEIGIDYEVHYWIDLNIRGETPGV